MMYKTTLMTAVFTAATWCVSACSGGGGMSAPVVAPPAPPPPAPPPPPPPPPPIPPSDFETAEYNEQVGLAHINASSAYAHSERPTGEGVVVAVVDTGIVENHSELIGRISDLSTDIVGDRGAGDVDGHGTGVAGVIAANKDGRYMHGVAFESTIMAIRTDTPDSCEADGGEGCTFSDSNIAKAITYAIENGAQIINLSLGRDPSVSDPGSTVFAALRDAVDRGIFVVISSGNADETDEDEEEAEPDDRP